jgi:hypothetical protein
MLADQQGNHPGALWSRPWHHDVNISFLVVQFNYLPDVHTDFV